MKTPRYLVPHLYTADPAVHVFNGKIYIYPSHDVESGIPENDNGDHFDMRDYHVFSMESIDGEVTDHGVVLDVKSIPWSGRQLWDSDAAHKDGKYYIYFSLKDRNDVFHIGVAVSDRPEGPFVAQDNPMKGSYSIDPCVFEEEDGSHYMYFGGLWGGQLQRYRDNKAIECGHEPADNEPALCSKVADQLSLHGDRTRFIPKWGYRFGLCDRGRIAFIFPLCDRRIVNRGIDRKRHFVGIVILRRSTGGGLPAGEHQDRISATEHGKTNIHVFALLQPIRQACRV